MKNNNFSPIPRSSASGGDTAEFYITPRNEAARFRVIPRWHCWRIIHHAITGIMLPKINRLTKKNDFNAVFQKGNGAKISQLIFKARKNGLQESRFGFIVSKKVSNKATIRNKIKRRLRSAVSRVKLRNPSDVIIITLPGAENLEFSEIKKATEEFFLKYK